MKRSKRHFLIIVSLVLCLAAGTAFGDVWLADLEVTVTRNNSTDTCVFNVHNIGDDDARDVIAVMHVISGPRPSHIVSSGGWSCFIPTAPEGQFYTVYC